METDSLIEPKPLNCPHYKGYKEFEAYVQNNYKEDSSQDT